MLQSENDTTRRSKCDKAYRMEVFQRFDPHEHKDHDEQNEQLPVEMCKVLSQMGKYTE